MALKRPGLLDQLDSALGGDLWKQVSEWRAEGASFDEITVRLRVAGTAVVSPETIRVWCAERSAPEQVA